MVYSIAGLLESLIGPKDGRTRPTLGGIRNNTAIPFVNNAGTANVDGIKLNTSDLVEIPAASLTSTLDVVGNLSVATNKFNVTAASGNTAIAGTANVVGDFSVATNKFNVTAASGNTAIAGTANVVGNFSVATNKFTAAASTGNTAIAGTLDVTGATALAGAVTQKAAVISGSGAGPVALTAAQSGSVVLFDRAAGTIYTLPTPAVGLYYDFHVTVSASGGNYKIITNTGTVLLIGSLINIDTDTSNAVAAWTADGSTHIAITMNGGTTGGLIGTKIRLTCLTTTRWMVEGIDQGSGSVATPFATS